jgi:hypothetical protein
MNLKGAVAAFVLVAVTLVTAGCNGLSCSGASSEVVTTDAIAATSSTTTTTAPTTTSSSTTTSSTTTSSTTTTTLSPFEAYRAAMNSWADEYGPDLAEAYTVMSGTNFNNPTPEQVQTAKDLDATMAAMVQDLGAIEPVPDLAAAHAGFLASLTKMAAGVHDLAQALEKGQSLLAYAAVATIAAAWQEGAADRTTLEQTLGFSLSG